MPSPPLLLLLLPVRPWRQSFQALHPWLLRALPLPLAGEWGVAMQSSRAGRVMRH